jgi:hypothetical protein
MYILLAILIIGGITGICSAFLRGNSGNIGENVGDNYMKEHWGIKEDNNIRED